MRLEQEYVFPEIKAICAVARFVSRDLPFFNYHLHNLFKYNVLLHNILSMFIVLKRDILVWMWKRQLC